MTTTRRIAVTLACAAGLAATAAWAAEPQPAPEKPAAPSAPAPATDQPFGWQMMTPEARAAHCQAMRNAKTPAEREQLRAAHHAQMAALAKQRGVTLPAHPMMAPGAGCRGMGGGMMGGVGHMGGQGMMGKPPAPPAPTP